MQQNIRQAGPSLQLSDLKSLRVFMTIADCGGLSAAQAKLGWSLSHISAILSNFEQRFGVRLCERGRSGFSLTPEGQHIYESSARLLQTLSVFESDLAAFRGILTGTLCIAGHGGDVTHERYVLPKVIRRFLSRDQNMANLRFETGSQDVIVNGVLNGTIDVAIGDTAEAVLVDGETVKGTVRYISREASPTTRTFRIEVAIPNPDNRIPAGMTSEITVRAASTDAVVLPRSVVTLNANGDLGIRAVDRESKIVFYPIDLVDDTARGFVLGGIPADAQIVVAGQDLVAEGDVVNAVPADRAVLDKLAGNFTGTN